MSRTFGIDISLWQKGIDLKKAKAEGVQFVIIKSSENNFADPQLDNHVKAAKAAGLPFGFYHWLKATDKAGAKREAQFCAQTVAKYKPFGYPVFVDVEDAKIKGLGKTKLTSIVKTFCNTIEGLGYWSGIYTNLDWYNNALDGASLAKRFSLWLAYWGKSCPLDSAQMWQFGGGTNLLRSCEVAGVVCDQDYCYVDYPAKIKARYLNGYTKASPAPKPSAALEKGDKIKIKKGATVYGSTEKFYPWVYTTTYKIVGITDNGNRIAFATLGGEVVGATDKKYVQKV